MFKTYNSVVLIGFALLSIAYLIGYSTLVSAGLQVRKVPYQVLFDYQLDKAHATNAETIFIGDSSLGNAIDAKVFSSLSNKQTENYALTGSFGFKGSLSMAKKAHNPHLKTIIIMQTLDMFTREVAKDYEPPKEILGIDLSAFNFTALKAFVKALKKQRFGSDADEEKFRLHNDYIEQGEPNAPDLIYKALNVSDIKTEKIEELRKIVNYCHKQKLNCVYIHGPIVEDICQSSQDYIAAINKIVIETGLTLANPAPVCLPKHKVGDAKDHVRPPFKEDYTKAFFEILKPYLTGTRQ